jgi:hypothetical protein
MRERNSAKISRGSRKKTDETRHVLCGGGGGGACHYSKDIRGYNQANRILAATSYCRVCGLCSLSATHAHLDRAGTNDSHSLIGRQVKGLFTLVFA